MKKFKKIYLEITNICNLDCAFCPKTTRAPQMMTLAEFDRLATALRPHGEYLYLHIKGEPTIHPQLAEMLQRCHDLGFRVCLTTNGTLLTQQMALLCSSPALHKIQVSLHSFEASDQHQTLEQYLDGIVALIQRAPCLVVLRLWNQGGMDQLNQRILEKVSTTCGFLSSNRINQTTYLEYGDRFTWGDLDQKSDKTSGFCYGLRDQIGVLVDGRVVPCCLDNNGDLALGNLFDSDLQSIYQSPRAQAIYNGFSQRKLVEPLCQTCGFANRFDIKTKI